MTRPKIPVWEIVRTIGFLLFLLALTKLIRWTKNGRRKFFETHEFPWVETLQASSHLIRRELDSMMTRIDLIPNFQDIQVEQRLLTRDNGWKTFIFYGYGARSEKNCARCPETHRLLSMIPGLTTAFFSILAPSKRLPPHSGPYNGVLRYHLALKIPKSAERCGIKVGGEVRHWEEGQSLIFDDSHIHEAWNDTDDVRVVLFVDFVRPLPWPMAAINRWAIRLIGRTGFIQEAVVRLEAWEKAVGAELDRAAIDEAAA